MLKVVKVGPDEVLPNFCILAIMRVAGGAKLETGTVRPRQSQEENWSTEFSQSRPGHWWGGEMSHHSRLKPLTTGRPDFLLSAVINDVGNQPVTAREISACGWTVRVLLLFLLILCQVKFTLLSAILNLTAKVSWKMHIFVQLFPTDNETTFLYEPKAAASFQNDSIREICVTRVLCCC